jgi:hypothetical protein
MEVEKISPVAQSPLDACRGRGKHPVLPRIRRARPRPCGSFTSTSESPTVVLLIIQEPLSKVGTPKDGSSSSNSTVNSAGSNKH